MTVFLVVGDIDSSEPVQMPEGTTTLGRGPPLNIMDERLSRQQAQITVDSSSIDVTMRSIGLNACYLKERDSSELQRLTNDMEVDVYHGDEYFLAGLVKLTVVVVSTSGPPPQRSGATGAKVIAAGSGGFNPKAKQLTTVQAGGGGGGGRKPSGARKPKHSAPPARNTGITLAAPDDYSTAPVVRPRKESGGRPGRSGSRARAGGGGAGGRGRGGGGRVLPAPGGESKEKAERINAEIRDAVQGTSFAAYEKAYLAAKGLKKYALPDSDMEYYDSTYADWKKIDDLQQALERTMRRGIDGLSELKKQVRAAEAADTAGWLAEPLERAKSKIREFEAQKKNARAMMG